MAPNAHRVFISYRRDDAAGFAGRLEAALEARLGPGSVFRDVIDIAPGEPFAQAIRSRLAGAQAVLVLIGPRWAGGDLPGPRRLDDEADFVRQEVAAALASGARVVPLLLPGAQMPSPDSLPLALRALTQRQALSLSDAHWDADIQRLASLLGAAPPRRRGLLALAAVVGVGAAGALMWLRPWAPADLQAPWQGQWQGDVRYSWGDRYTERFEFKRHAGEWTGSASFLGHPRAIEALRFSGQDLHFETRTRQTLGEDSRELIHRYSAEWRGQPPDEHLWMRLHSTGGFDTPPPLEFEVRRVAPITPAR